MRRRPLWALAAAVGAAAVPAAASAALLWTLVMTPLTTTANVSTTFTLTATNLLLIDDLGCLEVDLPESFVIESLGTPQASNGDAWASTQSANAVIVHSLSGGGRLEMGEWVRFTIRAHATVAGTFLWPNHAHRHQACTTEDEIGVPLTVTVLPAVDSTPTPSPTPTPADTPTPTPAATPAPSLTPSSILPLPSIDLRLPTPTPTTTPTQRTTATPEPSSSPAGDGSGATGARPGADGGGAAGSVATQTLQVAGGADQTGADTEVGVDLLGLLDADVWLVPAASVALPGLLVILWVVLQAIGALAWIPAVRRMDTEDAGRRRAEAG